MQDILIIAHFTQVPGETGNGRFHYIAEAMAKKGNAVEVVTTSFSHKTKQQRSIALQQLDSIDYQLTMLHEPGYTHNVSLKRIRSHGILGKNLKNYLKNRKKPDVLYCAVPSLDVAYIAAQYATRHRIRFLIDIQDLWPEAYKMIFHFPIISDLLYRPMQKKAHYIYAMADEVIAVSQTYVNVAMQSNKKNHGHAVYLGTELLTFDRIGLQPPIIEKNSNELWLVYLGTLGNSYDLIGVIDALAMIKNNDIPPIKFVVIGDGPLQTKFEQHAKQRNIDALFMGRLNYADSIAVLHQTDIAVNPIRLGSAASVVNKVADYAAAGLPVINTQDCQEYKDLVENYQIGLNCICNNATDLANQLLHLCKETELRHAMGINNRRLAEERFDRANTYQAIFKLIEGGD